MIGSNFETSNAFTSRYRYNLALLIIRSLIYNYRIELSYSQVIIALNLVIETTGKILPRDPETISTAIAHSTNLRRYPPIAFVSSLSKYLQDFL